MVQIYKDRVGEETIFSSTNTILEAGKQMNEWWLI